MSNRSKSGRGAGSRRRQKLKNILSQRTLKVHNEAIRQLIARVEALENKLGIDPNQSLGFTETEESKDQPNDSEEICVCLHSKRDHYSNEGLCKVKGCKCSKYTTRSQRMQEDEPA